MTPKDTKRPNRYGYTMQLNIAKSADLIERLEETPKGQRSQIMEQALRAWFKMPQDQQIPVARLEGQLDEMNQKLTAIQRTLQSGVAMSAPTQEPSNSAGDEQLRRRDEQMAKNMWYLARPQTCRIK